MIKVKMALKNYTTQIPVDRTITDIEKILAQHGARKILKDYDNQGNISAISFMIKLEDGSFIPFKLPMNLERVLLALREQYNSGTLTSSQKSVVKRGLQNHEQARKIGWRIIKDWIDAQMSILDLHLAKMQEVFLPYAYNMEFEKTFYEMIEEKGFGDLALEDKSK